MELVARVDAFRRVSGKEISVKRQAGRLFYNRDALLFCHARIYGRFVNHNVALGDNLSHALAGA